MKILVVNPNTNVETTERLRAVSVRVAAEGTVVEAVTAPRGVRVIKTLESVERAAEVVLDTLAARARTVDGAIIAAFSDPGLRRARAAHALPVVGIGQAAMLAAAKIGHRFSIVTMGSSMSDYLRARSRDYGVAHKLASIRVLPWSVLGGRPCDFERLCDECLHAIRSDGADAVVIGGGPLAGVAEEVGQVIERPALDGMVCAVRLVEHLSRRSDAGRAATP